MPRGTTFPSINRSAWPTAKVAGNAPGTWDQLSLDNNLYDCPTCPEIIKVEDGAWVGFADLDAFRAAYPQPEGNGQQGAPQFVSAPGNFRLSAESTLALDRGSAAPGLVDVDLEGTSRPQGAGWDIGPYEFGVGGPGSPGPPTGPILLNIN